MATNKSTMGELISSDPALENGNIIEAILATLVRIEANQIQQLALMPRGPQ